MMNVTQSSASSSQLFNIKLEIFLMVYVFPVQLIVGLTGNTCNLIVLLSREMRSKTNILLAMMACADMMLLIFMIPHSLMFHKNLTRYPKFRSFIVHAMPHIAGICNLCSFISAWLVVVVCGERVMAVVCPLKARSFWSTKALKAICASILIFAVILSMHSHITHRVQDVLLNITVVDKDGVPRQQLRKTQQAVLREGMQQYWHLAVSLDIIFLVLLPVFLVITANMLLITCLRRQRIAKLKTQRRVTTIVFTIATTFTVCQVPSALVYIWEMVKHGNGSQALFRTLATLSNSIVVSGKAINFFLFCMWSVHFRKQLCCMLQRRAPQLFNCVRYFLLPNASSKTNAAHHFHHHHHHHHRNRFNYNANQNINNYYYNDPNDRYAIPLTSFDRSTYRTKYRRCTQNTLCPATSTQLSVTAASSSTRINAGGRLLNMLNFHRRSVPFNMRLAKETDRRFSADNARDRRSSAGETRPLNRIMTNFRRHKRSSQTQELLINNMPS